MPVIRFGTRGSALALWQTRHVMALLEAAHPDIHTEHLIIQTKGDQVLDTPLPLVGGKGVFTAELESALHEGRIDCAVHSLKDLPTTLPDGLTIAALPPRASAADVLISRAGYTMGSLPHAARIGTSSTRRAAQLLYARPDLHIVNIRGNVDTRLQKALAGDGDYDAILLAHAGLERLGRLDVVTQVLSIDAMLPAPGQGAIAVQTRSDPALAALFAPLHHRETALAVTAERAFLAGLGGGCSVPVAAYATVSGDALHVRGRVNAPDGTAQIDVGQTAIYADERTAYAVGHGLAQTALSQGAAALVEPSP
ncbi:MAG: hydroxymethylbilane synthase [bacterium]|nr:hydroxymethylbilane synthase [bacterium]